VAVSENLKGQELKIAVTRTKQLPKSYEELKKDTDICNDLESIRARRELTTTEEKQLRRTSSTIEESQAEGAKLPKVLTVTGASGRAVIINGAYQRECVLDGRPIYVHRKPLPAQYASAAGKRLYLYFHESSECWVISTTLGSMDVVAFLPDVAKHPHEARAPWMLATASGVYSDDPNVKIQVTFSKRVSFNELRLSEVKLIQADGVVAENPHRLSLPSVIFEGLKPPADEGEVDDRAEEKILIGEPSFSSSSSTDEDTSTDTSSTTSTGTKESTKESERSSISASLSSDFLKELLSTGPSSVEGYQRWEPVGEENAPLSKAEEEKKVKEMMLQARRAKSKSK
jgi:hypothetical protein